MKKIVLGTDVILDVLFDRKTFAQPAAEVLSLCEQRKIEGYISPLALASIFHTLKKSAGYEEIAEKISTLLIFLDVLQLEKKDFLQGLNSEFTDLECAVQAYAAENCYTIQAIVTRNTDTYKHTAIPVFAPDEFLIDYKSNI